MRSALQRFWPIPCLALLLVVAYGPTLASGGLLATGDGLGYYMPARAIAAACVQHGELPFWNPFNFSGMPLLAAFQGGVFFPANWVFLLFTPGAAMNLAVLSGYGLAGLATYAYARALLLPRSAAFLAGASFMGGGYMVAHLEHLTMLHGAAMLPAMLWAVERQMATARTRYALALAAGLSLQVFAGYPQTVVISLVLLAAYVLCRRPASPWPLAAALVLGLGLAAVQLVPGLDLLGASPRGQLGYDELVATSLPPRQLASLLFPFLFGAEPSMLFPTPYWGGGTWPNELTGYMGLVPLMLAGCALVLGSRRGLTWFWALAGLTALLLALGGATPLYHLWAAVPGLKIVRVPGRHLMEVDLAVAMLAALGWSGLLAAGPTMRRWAVLLGGGAVMAALGLGFAAVALAGPAAARHWQPLMPPGVELAGVLRPGATAVWLPLLLGLAGWAALAALAVKPGVGRRALVLALALLDLGLFGQCQGWRQLAPHPRAWPGLPPPPGAYGRVLAVDEAGYPFHDYERMLALGYPQLAFLWGVRGIGGYEPMLPARYARLAGGMSLAGALGDERVWHGGVLDLLACQQVRVSPKLLREPRWQGRLAAPRWQAEGETPLAATYTNTHAGRQLWRASAVRSLPVGQVDALMLGQAPAPGTALLDAPAAAVTTPGTAALLRRGFGWLDLETTGPGPGLVVLSEGYDAGWRAWSEAGPLPVQRVDGLVLGVAVPAGAQHVHLAYQPPRWWTGVGVSGASALLLLLWGLAARRRAVVA